MKIKITIDILEVNHEKIHISLEKNKKLIESVNKLASKICEEIHDQLISYNIKSKVDYEI